jgi:hypothetical protein
MEKKLLINWVSPVALNDCMQKIMEQIGEDDIEKIVKLINSGKVVVNNIKSWEDKKCKAFFSVTSDGTSGPQWFQRLKSKGIEVDERVKAMLFSSNFQPTSGVTTNLMVIKSEFTREKCKSIPQEVETKKLIIPSLESLCLVREKFSIQQIMEMCHGVLIIPTELAENKFIGINGWSHDRIPGIYVFPSYDCNYAGQMFELSVE